MHDYAAIHEQNPEPSLTFHETLTPPADDPLAHRVLPYYCGCGYALVGFTQTFPTHSTVYAHCVNKHCANWLNTQELSFYLDTAS